MMKIRLVSWVIILSVTLAFGSYGWTAEDKSEMQWKFINTEIIDVHETSPYTITTKIKNKRDGDAEGSFTIDSDCAFYKNGELSSTGINILKPGDKVEIQYTISEGEKVAFNVYISE